MSKVFVKCDWCGAILERYPCKVKDKNFCNRDCMNKFASKKYNPDGYKYRDFSKNSKRMTEMNLRLNPTRMTVETRMKLRKAHLGRGTGRSYEKFFGKHKHRLVAESMLGRKLLPGEIVHHKDEDRRNNEPNNLKVFKSQKDHAHYHQELNRFFSESSLGSEVMSK